MNCSAFKRLKGIQRHWYVFEESTLKLMAYRNEMDAAIPDKEPLKIINIHGAVFHIDPAEHNQFSIMSDGKEHILQAETEDAMLLWLHVLQTRRNEAVHASESDSSSPNDDSLTDYKLFRQNSLMKMQMSIPTRLSPIISSDSNESSLNGSIITRKTSMKMNKLIKQESIDQMNDNHSLTDQSTNLFHSSWISPIENTMNNETTRRLSYNRSSSYDSEIVKQHVNDYNFNEKYNKTISKSNSSLHYRIDQSPKGIYHHHHRNLMNLPIEEEEVENEDYSMNEKLYYNRKLSMKLNGENRSQLRTTMKVLDNVSEKKCQVNNQKEELICKSMKDSSLLIVLV
ncbi:unnamed protein product [Schistosoma margrebowiei]|uniref:Uncharacterized protein n=2 Tax=Schistosoma TaxID=6181 RepID=A0A183MK55_9TREM|nr:unnamed protein product [Schistosoma margrebowiei]